MNLELLFFFKFVFQLGWYSASPSDAGVSALSTLLSDGVTDVLGDLVKILLQF